ncbi:MAG: hypothetical protein AB2A00_22590 [Myxococcota bacterium]
MPARCDRCQAELPEGALRYQARLRLCGDTGGVVKDPPGGAQAGRQQLDAALREAERLTEAELMEAVMEEFCFVLCPECRDALRTDPAGAANMRVGRVRLRQ